MKKTRKEMHKKNYFDPYGKLNFFLLFRINDYKVIFRNISFKNIKNNFKQQISSQLCFYVLHRVYFVLL